jgi:hypothetical protein
LRGAGVIVGDGAGCVAVGDGVADCVGAGWVAVAVGVGVADRVGVEDAAGWVAVAVRDGVADRVGVEDVAGCVAVGDGVAMVGPVVLHTSGPSIELPAMPTDVPRYKTSLSTASERAL